MLPISDDAIFERIPAFLVAETLRGHRSGLVTLGTTGAAVQVDGVRPPPDYTHFRTAPFGN
jgi:hypothetical protein